MQTDQSKTEWLAAGAGSSPSRLRIEQGANDQAVPAAAARVMAEWAVKARLALLSCVEALAPLQSEHGGVACDVTCAYESAREALSSWPHGESPVRPVGPMMGSAAAMDRTQKLIAEWTDTRTGCLETLAEWMMTRTNVTLDDGLNAMSSRGLIKDWPNAQAVAPAALDAATPQDASSRLPACDCSHSEL